VTRAPGLRRQAVAAMTTAIACVLAAPSAPAASPPSTCLMNENGVCFEPVSPAANERISVLIVLGNRLDYYCVRDLVQNVVGKVIRYDGVYDDCGDKAQASPLYYNFSLGPLAPGHYDVVFDPPTAQDVAPPPDGPLTFRTTLDVGPAVETNTAIPVAIEYFRAAANHYFITAKADEIDKLDSGVFAGWTRTGQAIDVYAASTMITPPLSPVCRLYGNPAAGLDSHFYSASPAECQSVLDRFGNAWIYESPDVFVVALPDAITGQCPARTLPVYRLYNNRADANHRFTTSFDIRVQMVVAGWIAEGYGPGAVAMCAPVPP